MHLRRLAAASLAACLLFAAPAQAGTAHANPGHTNPGHTNPGRTNLGSTNPGQNGSAQVGRGDIILAQANPLGSATGADPFAQLNQFSSQTSSRAEDGVHQALRSAYQALPEPARNHPGIANQARAMGLVDPPVRNGTVGAAGASASSPAPGCANCVALTFDDGPATPTHQLLDILDRKRVQASFFVLAPKANAQPQLLRRMDAAGHTIGNHTATHRELNKLDAASVDREIAQGNDAVRAATGHGTRWMRPPYGATNDTVAAAAARAGAAQAFWSVDTLDWKTRNTEQTCRTAVGEAKPGAIILMHDIHPSTVAAVECIIDGLRAKGLAPVNLDTLIPHPQPGRIYYSRP
ncbi:polysaccharide deacetylase family protein [Corynebacterium lizhenjunii]|uniref:polysaccharide deacetylase family protein n=1 Tax=Corynebacterium lizhenjunii TaxID=2709394 RepID=UPI001FD38647|nr:polysaccharide deacetylase family protein [Corynebacterium lizhenjunii]